MNDVFDVILDGSLSHSEDNEMEYGRKPTLSSCTSPMMSKQYMRPIFKDPGSMISQITNQKKHYRRENNTIPTMLKSKRENQPNSVNPILYRSQAIEPSIYHTRRLEYIVGNPIERFEFNNGDKPVTLRTRLVQNQSQSYQEGNRSFVYNSKCVPDCGSSVASVSDLDSLEAKIFHRKRPLSEACGGELNVLRREINKIVSSNNVDVRDPRVVNHRTRLPDKVARDEEREGYEGCASHGCVFLEDGVGSVMHDLISNMKESLTG